MYIKQYSKKHSDTKDSVEFKYWNKALLALAIIVIQVQIIIITREIK